MFECTSRRKQATDDGGVPDSGTLGEFRSTYFIREYMQNVVRHFPNHTRVVELLIVVGRGTANITV